MKLPPDYLDLVSTAADVLRSLAAHGRHDAARRPDAPELWLAVRDYEGLADRLAALNDWAWRNGFGHLQVNGQDIGVLDELLIGSGASGQLSETQAQVVADLRQFLDRYGAREYELDSPQPTER